MDKQLKEKFDLQTGQTDRRYYMEWSSGWPWIKIKFCHPDDIEKVLFNRKWIPHHDIIPKFVEIRNNIPTIDVHFN